MSATPLFEIGLWNAWTFALAGLFFHAVPPILAAEFNTNLRKKFSEESPTNVYLNNTEKRIDTVSLILLILVLVYTVFLPLELGTAWFYTGLAIFVSGVIVYLATVPPWSATPLAEPVTTGLYRYSRHPIYLTIFVQLIAVAIASASWLFILLTIVLMILFPVSVIPEERGCLAKYGDAYREYMNKTPRWLGKPKKA